ncbi:TetR/AcrR family transcriptional regulator [Mycolicibacterium fortuitum]|uniref:TetR/AcrR family transcriptional regulator n=2 Tax=Mycolicibacterium fortuitum TaxID=1766 RepID=A0AAE4VE51_MYCFO|nr:MULTISPECIES: TetR/AcrR family transcriptional regulator [Mycolicibacterium]MBP3083467.1 TetR/AcrR family transcriptional regulator [Mycolicibacterium fortuitum]MCA4724809.1 TetR/AcrR family transcriptional regulator [Mycolicibacterium fortuitum]MCV7141198.1 TetR/AcrR family transcriptional regulator [Mycolicibacterium fortuitum]MDV7192127.1 TetR/AcrR family transcriptional regulator [Mycolicibacterium fortuitum]MDV7206254.1 TetR/AcrR family transcriptional regulator [Mycolicibacterium fort
MVLVMPAVKPTRIRPTRDEVRDRILDAALKVFAAEGFAGATIDAIGHAAGFTKGAVYSNFESKDELFLALLDRQFESRGALIATALDSGQGDTAAIAAALSRSTLDSIHDQNEYQIVLIEYWLRAVRDPELRERLVARRRAAADQALRIVEQAGTSLPGKQLAALAQLVVTIISGIATEEVLQPGTVDVDTLTRLFTALLESSPDGQ